MDGEPQAAAAVNLQETLAQPPEQIRRGRVKNRDVQQQALPLDGGQGRAIRS